MKQKSSWVPWRGAESLSQITPKVFGSGPFLILPAKKIGFLNLIFICWAKVGKVRFLQLILQTPISYYQKLIFKHFQLSCSFSKGSKNHYHLQMVITRWTWQLKSIFGTLQMLEAKLQTNQGFYLLILHNNSVIQNFYIWVIIT